MMDANNIMNFQIDPQIINDVMPIYDFTLNNVTKAALIKYLNTPINDIELIAERQAIIQAIMQHQKIINKYYYYRSEFHECYDFLRIKYWDPYIFTFNLKTIFSTSIYQKKCISQIKQLILFLYRLENICFQYFDTNKFPNSFSIKLQNINSFLSSLSLSEYNILLKNDKIRFKHYKTIYALLRSKAIDGTIENFTNYLITFEVFVSIAKCSIQNNFCFPKMGSEQLNITNFYHPLLKNPINNTWNPTTNLSIITGPNMSGKSTFLKTIAIIIWLAHVGVSIPASYASIPVYHNFLLSLNNTDDLEAGNSYFMNELNKLKIAIEMLLQQDRSLIIFDELFRGTNYQDATRISNTTIEGLCKSKNSDIIISTHLDNFVHNNATFQETIGCYYFNCIVENETPYYTYKLLKGWSTIKIGTLLFKTNGLDNLLKKI